MRAILSPSLFCRVVKQYDQMNETSAGGIRDFIHVHQTTYAFTHLRAPPAYQYSFGILLSCWRDPENSTGSGEWQSRFYPIRASIKPFCFWKIISNIFIVGLMIISHMNFTLLIVLQ